MKKSLFSIGVLILIMSGILQSCRKDNTEYDGTSFIVNVDGFTDENGKAHFETTSFLKLLFQEGDVIKVNGRSFTLRYEGGRWVAKGSSAEMDNATHDTLLGNEFYCYYGQSPAPTSPIGSSTYTGINFASGGSSDAVHPGYKLYNSGIVLAGKTTDSTITFYPTFAVIKLHRHSPDGITMNQALLGFSSGVCVKIGKVTPQSGTPIVEATESLRGISMSSYYDEDFEEYVTSYSGDFLTANESDLATSGDGADTYHFIIPLPSQSISTSLYLRYTMTNNSSGTTAIKYGKVDNVNLQRGKVYTINVN